MSAAGQTTMKSGQATIASGSQFRSAVIKAARG